MYVLYSDRVRSEPTLSEPGATAAAWGWCTLHIRLCRAVSVAAAAAGTAHSTWQPEAPRSLSPTEFGGFRVRRLHILLWSHGLCRPRPRSRPATVAVQTTALVIAAVADLQPQLIGSRSNSKPKTRETRLESSVQKMPPSRRQRSSGRDRDAPRRLRDAPRRLRDCP